jgi:hypothetical protein
MLLASSGFRPAPDDPTALLHAAIRLQEHLQAFVSFQNLVASISSSTATDPTQDAHLRQLATTLQQSCLRFLRDHVARYQDPQAACLENSPLLCAP